MVYRKGIHNGQYVYMNSFHPWERKAAMIKALYRGATKVCGTPELLKQQFSVIQEEHLQ